MIETYPELLPTHVRQALGCDDAPNRRFDTVIQGRRTYQPALDLGITSPYAHLRQLVASTSLTPSPDPAVEVTTDPLTRVRELKAEAGSGIYLAGGGTLAAALGAEIDELVIKVYPVLAGAGLGIFGGAFAPRAFRLVDSRIFASGAAVNTYRSSGADR